MGLRVVDLILIGFHKLIHVVLLVMSQNHNVLNLTLQQWKKSDNHRHRDRYYMLNIRTAIDNPNIDENYQAEKAYTWMLVTGNW